MKKIVIAFSLIVTLFLVSVVPAHAASKAEILWGILKFAAKPEIVGSGEDQAVYVDSLWKAKSNFSPTRIAYMSYDSLSSACFDLNGNGFPCRIAYGAFGDVAGYYILGTGKAYLSDGFNVNISNRCLTDGSGMLFLARFDTDSLLQGISERVNHILISVNSISTNITQLMASNGYLASINNKLASLTSIGTKLDTISDLLNANTYCCGYITNSSGAEFPTQSISFSIAEQIVARLNSEMQGKTLTVLKRDGSGTTTSTFRRAYVTSSSMICLVMSGGTYYLCDSTNTIFKAGSDRLSNIYSKVNSMATTLTNIAGSIDTVESKLSTLATKLDTLHTDNSTIVGGIDTVSAKISGVVSKLDTLHTDAASVISAIKALPDYSDKLDTITELLTTNTYTCGYLTDAGGTAYGTIPISYDSAEAIVARLNTQLPGKQITYLPREGAPYASDFDYCALDSSLYIRVYSGQYSYYLCDSGNRLYKASADRVNVIDARLTVLSKLLASIDTGISSLGKKLDKLPTSYPLPDLTTIESAALGLESMVGSTYEIMSDLKARLDGLEVIVVGGEPTDLTTIESTLSNLDSNISQLHADNIGLVGVINTMNNTLGDLNVKLGDLKTSLGGLEVNITGGSSGSADLTKVESALSTIIDKMDNLPASVDNIVVNITQDNDAYNVFYVEDENGDKKSVTSVAGDSLSASGKLLQFLYKLVIGSALDNVDDSIGGLGGFFFDDAPSGLGEGVTVWD